MINNMKHRWLVIRIFQVIEIGLILLVLGVGYGVVKGVLDMWIAKELGEKMATLSTLLLITALLPGISRRMGVLLILNTWLMPVRRHIGILMFVTAWGHAMLSNYLPRYLTGTMLALPPKFVTFGFFGLLIALPLFLTSNDYSVRKLKRNWERLQKLVYLVLLMVLVHIAIQGENLALLVGLVLILEVISYLFVYFKRRKVG